MSSDRPWWTPEAHADRRPFWRCASASRRRSAPGSRPRASSRSRPACLQVSPGNEAHLHAFATELDRARPQPRDALPAHLAGARLQEAAGRGRAQASLRSRPCSAIASAAPLHAPEFTMLEWYRADAPYEAVMDGLRRDAEARGRDRGQPLRLLARRDRQPARRARAAHGRAKPSPATPGSTCSPHDRARQRPRRARRHGRGAGITPRHDDTWSDIFCQGADRAHRAQARQRPRHAAHRISRRAKRRWRGAPRAIRASPSASSSTAAGSSSPTALAS